MANTRAAFVTESAKAGLSVFCMELPDGTVVLAATPGKNYKATAQAFKTIMGGEPVAASSSGTDNKKSKKNKKRKNQNFKFFPGDLCKTLEAHVGGAFRGKIAGYEDSDGQRAFPDDDIDTLIADGTIVSERHDGDDDDWLSLPDADTKLQECVDAIVAKAVEKGGSIIKPHAGEVLVHKNREIYSSEFLTMILRYMVDEGYIAEGERVGYNQTYLLMQDDVDA